MDGVGCKYFKCEGAALLPSAMNHCHFAITTQAVSLILRCHVKLDWLLTGLGWSQLLCRAAF